MLVAVRLLQKTMRLSTAGRHLEQAVGTAVPSTVSGAGSLGGTPRGSSHAACGCCSAGGDARAAAKERMSATPPPGTPNADMGAGTASAAAEAGDKHAETGSQPAAADADLNRNSKAKVRSYPSHHAAVDAAHVPA